MFKEERTHSYTHKMSVHQHEKKHSGWSVYLPGVTVMTVGCHQGQRSKEEEE